MTYKVEFWPSGGEGWLIRCWHYALWVSFLTFYHVINCKVVIQDKPNKKPTILGWFIQLMCGDFGDGLLILGFTTLLCLVYEAA